MVDAKTVKTIVAAIREGKQEQFEQLIANDAAKKNAGEQFGSWLHVAAKYGQLEIVKRLVEMGLDINATNHSEERPPLLLAVIGKSADVVAFLLSKGARMDVRKVWFNPLFTAIDGNQPEIVAMLIDAGIDTRLKYRWPSGLKDALAYATEKRRKAIVNLIEAAHARQDASAATGKPQDAVHASGSTAPGLDVDNVLLETATSEGIIAFRKAIERFPREKFYAFCFYTVSDVNSVYPHANTLEGYARIDTSQDPHYFKWAPAEWKLEFGQYGDSELMKETNQLLSRREFSHGEFAEHKHRTIATLSQALINIKNSSIFSGHADVNRLAFWVHVGDLGGEEEWMFESVIDHMPDDIVEELRKLFEFNAKKNQKSESKKKSKRRKA